MNILQSEERFPFDQRQIIEQAKFTYSSVGKTFKKQTKKIEKQAKKKTNRCYYESKQKISGFTQ